MWAQLASLALTTAASQGGGAGGAPAGPVSITQGGISGSPLGESSTLEQLTPLLLGVLALAGLYLLKKG